MYREDTEQVIHGTTVKTMIESRGQGDRQCGKLAKCSPYTVCLTVEIGQSSTDGLGVDIPDTDEVVLGECLGTLWGYYDVDGRQRYRTSEHSRDDAATAIAAAITERDAAILAIIYAIAEREASIRLAAAHRKRQDDDAHRIMVSRGLAAE